MDIGEDWIKAMQFNYPEYIPVDVILLPATWIKYREALDELVARHPVIFSEQAGEDRDYDEVYGKYGEGEYLFR